jgi:hypothetical protein
MKDTHGDRNSTSHAKITPDNCMDCAGEREQYGAMYCPIHYQTAIDVGDSLYNNMDKKMYLVLQIDYEKDYILITDIKDNKFTIGTDAQTLSKFKLIKSQD